MVEDTRWTFIGPHVLSPYLGHISGLRVNRDLCQIILLIPGRWLAASMHTSAKYETCASCKRYRLRNRKLTFQSSRLRLSSTVIYLYNNRKLSAHYTPLSLIKCINLQERRFNSMLQKKNILSRYLVLLTVNITFI